MIGFDDAIISLMPAHTHTHNHNENAQEADQAHVHADASPAETPRRRRRHVDEYSLVMRSLAPTANPLRAFAAKPIKTSFATQEAEEQLILLLRRHPVTQVAWVFFAIVAALIPVFFDPGSFFKLFAGNVPSCYHDRLVLGCDCILTTVIFDMVLQCLHNHR